jgi:hypothetical protein
MMLALIDWVAGERTLFLFIATRNYGSRRVTEIRVFPDVPLRGQNISIVLIGKNSNLTPIFTTQKLICDKRYGVNLPLIAPGSSL